MAGNKLTNCRQRCAVRPGIGRANEQSGHLERPAGFVTAQAIKAAVERGRPVVTLLERVKNRAALRIHRGDINHRATQGPTTLSIQTPTNPQAKPPATLLNIEIALKMCRRCCDVKPTWIFTDQEYQEYQE
jgi:hypothetical protein